MASVVEKTKWAGRVFFKLPLQIHQYNGTMGSVDKADQLLEPYSSGRKTLSWFKKLGMHFVDRMVLNAYIVYSNRTASYTGDLMQFIMDVAEGLICEYRPKGRQLIQ